MKKLARYLIIGYTVLIILMLTAGLVRYSMLGGNMINPKIEDAIIGFAQFPAKVFHLFKPGALADERYVFDTISKSGINYNVDTSKLSSGYLLVSTFKKNKDLEFKLLDLKKNIVIKNWNINPDTILLYTKKEGLTRNSIRLIHPLLLKDSSLIFNTANSLIKINKASKVVWANKGLFHHSVEYANDTSIWVCHTIINKKPIYILTVKDTLVNSGIALVNSMNGKVIYQKSIFDILKENGYKYLMAIGNFENDEFHLNEVNPAQTDSKYWKKGDLLISLRDRSTVFLYRPSTNKILWLKTGPWANQHCCTFAGDDRIMILGNDVIRSNNYEKFINKQNSIYVFDFKNNTVNTPYAQILNQLKLKTYTEGRCNILPNGDVFFDESNNGRVYIFDTDKVKMTYCERIDNKHIKMLNWVRYIPQ